MIGLNNEPVSFVGTVPQACTMESSPVRAAKGFSSGAFATSGYIGAAVTRTVSCLGSRGTGASTAAYSNASRWGWTGRVSGACGSTIHPSSITLPLVSALSLGVIHFQACTICQALYCVLITQKWIWHYSCLQGPPRLRGDKDSWDVKDSVRMNAQDSCSKTPVNNQVRTGVHIAPLVLLAGCVITGSADFLWKIRR